MKTIKLAAVLFAALSFTACGALQGTSTTQNRTSNVNLLDVASVVNANTTASNAGSTAGAALNSLYATYRQNGKIDLTNLTTLISVAQLVNSCQSLKSSDATYKKSFGTGLVLGSMGLVTQSNSNTVTSALASTMSNINTNSLASLLTASQTNNQTSNSETVNSLANALGGGKGATSSTTSSSTRTSNTASTVAATANEVSNITNSVSSILSLFGK
jgi:hypothetical protein